MTDFKGMTSGLHTIKPAKGSHKRSKRLGRGNGSQKGTTAGRGMKGQRARSGGKRRGAIRAFKDALQKVPKLRGFKRQSPAVAIVNLSVLNEHFKDNDKVAPEAWGEAMAALIEAIRDGRPGEGLAAEVRQVGAILATHFPRAQDDINELPDRLIEL